MKFLFTTKLYIRCLIKNYRDFAIKKATIHINSVFKLFWRSPLLKPHNLSSVASVEWSTPGTPFLRQHHIHLDCLDDLFISLGTAAMVEICQIWLLLNLGNVVLNQKLLGHWWNLCGALRRYHILSSVVPIDESINGITFLRYRTTASSMSWNRAPFKWRGKRCTGAWFV